MAWYKIKVFCPLQLLQMNSTHPSHFAGKFLVLRLPIGYYLRPLSMSLILI